MSYPYCDYCGMFCSDTICETCWKWGKHLQKQMEDFIEKDGIRYISSEYIKKLIDSLGDEGENTIVLDEFKENLELQ